MEDITFKDIEPIVVFENIATRIADLDQNQVTEAFVSQIQIEYLSFNANGSNRNSIRGKTRQFPLKLKGDNWGNPNNPALGPNRSLRTTVHQPISRWSIWCKTFLCATACMERYRKARFQKWQRSGMINTQTPTLLSQINLLDYEPSTSLERLASMPSKILRVSLSPTG